MKPKAEHRLRRPERVNPLPCLPERKRKGRKLDYREGTPCLRVPLALADRFSAQYLEFDFPREKAAREIKSNPEPEG
jgi:hypothetical protein